MNLAAAADIAASFLLLGMLIVHTVLAAALFVMWRLLRGAERAIKPAAVVATDRLEDVRARLQHATNAAVAPQITWLSRWAGVQAGWAVLTGRSDTIRR